MLLELFRNHKRWLMFIAMVLVIPSFVVTGIYSYNRMISDDGAIAKVDDVSILPQQFDEAKRQRLETCVCVSVKNSVPICSTARRPRSRCSKRS